MKKYIYGLVGLGVAAALGTYAVSAQTTPPTGSTPVDAAVVNSDLSQNLIEWQVQMDGWTMLAKQGDLTNPAYRATLSSDINSISSQISLYQTLEADSNQK